MRFIRLHPFANIYFRIQAFKYRISFLTGHTFESTNFVQESKNKTPQLLTKKL